MNNKDLGYSRAILLENIKRLNKRVAILEAENKELKLLIEASSDRNQ